MVAETQKMNVAAGDDYRYGFAMPENYVFKSRKGLDEEVVREISYMKSEPEWMTQLPRARAQALRSQADAPVGRRPQRHRLSMTSLLCKGHATATATPGTTCPTK